MCPVAQGPASPARQAGVKASAVFLSVCFLKPGFRFFGSQRKGPKFAECGADSPATREPYPRSAVFRSAIAKKSKLRKFMAIEIREGRNTGLSDQKLSSQATFHRFEAI